MMGKVWCRRQLLHRKGQQHTQEEEEDCELFGLNLLGLLVSAYSSSWLFWLTFPARVSMLTLRPTGLSSCHRFLIPIATYNTARTLSALDWSAPAAAEDTADLGS